MSLFNFTILMIYVFISVRITVLIRNLKYLNLTPRLRLWCILLICYYLGYHWRLTYCFYRKNLQWVSKKKKRSYGGGIVKWFKMWKTNSGIWKQINNVIFSLFLNINCNLKKNNIFKNISTNKLLKSNNLK